MGEGNRTLGSVTVTQLLKMIGAHPPVSSFCKQLPETEKNKEQSNNTCTSQRKYLGL